MVVVREHSELHKNPLCTVCDYDFYSSFYIFFLSHADVWKPTISRVLYFLHGMLDRNTKTSLDLRSLQVDKLTAVYFMHVSDHVTPPFFSEEQPQFIHFSSM